MSAAHLTAVASAKLDIEGTGTIGRSELERAEEKHQVAGTGACAKAEVIEISIVDLAGNPSQGTACVKVKPDTTVGMLKHLLHKLLSVPPMCQSLIVGDVCLQDDSKPLKMCGLEHAASVSLVKVCKIYSKSTQEMYRDYLGRNTIRVALYPDGNLLFVSDMESGMMIIATMSSTWQLAHLI